MPTKTLFSRHVKKSSLKENDASAIQQDILLFNKVERNAYSLDNFGEPSPPADSIHVQLKKKYNLNDYFVNSAHNEAKALRKSAIECLKLHIKEKESQITQMESKLKSIDKSIKRLTAIKNQLINISKARKHKKKKAPSLKFVSGQNEYISKDGFITTGRRKPVHYKDEYEFEVLYVTPKLKELRHRKNVIEKRKTRTEHELLNLQSKLNSNHPSVIFGGHKLFRRQFNGDFEHSVWKNQYDKSRNRRMTISGRSDALQGNFVFRYDTDKKELIYTSMNGSIITFPCEFPYGQEWVCSAVNAIPSVQYKKLSPEIIREQNLWLRKSVCWSIEDWGNSFLIKCMITVPENPYKNHYYKDGCIAFDMNPDNISIAETDKDGNLLHHEVIEFDILNKSSEQIEHILSEALEKVFNKAESTNKPIAFEDIEQIEQKSLYRGKRLNQVLSTFAYQKMTSLTESKSDKYGISVKKVNPAFTSQIGKTKYMKRYGLSVHESAAFVIARRGMGLKEKIPHSLKKLIPDNRINRHHWSHWRFLHNRIKKIGWRSVYQKSIASQLL